MPHYFLVKKIDNMDIAYSINEKYVGYCLVSVCSLLDNNRGCRINIHILYDSLLPDSINRIRDFIAQRGGNVVFHEVAEESVSGLILNSWPQSAWYRIFLPQILGEDVERVLYLDSDTIVSGPIAELFEMDMNGKSLAGCVDVMTLNDEVFTRLGYHKSLGYICSGVLLINLDYFRIHNITQEILSYAKKNAEVLKYPDQDAINYICRDTKLLLPLKYETMNSYFRNDEFVNLYHDQFADMIADHRIIHYAGCPPWFIETSVHPFTNLFWHYAKQVCGIKMCHFSSGMTILKNIVKFILGKVGVDKYNGHCKLSVRKFAKKHHI